MVLTCFKLFLAFLLLLGSTDAQLTIVRSSFNHLDDCFPVPTYHECVRMPYNVTSLPNFSDDRSIILAMKRFEQLRPILESKCSTYLLTFLCSHFFPLCIQQTVRGMRVLPPCRSLCDKVRQDCLPNIERLNLEEQSVIFDCDRWKAGEELCFGNKTIKNQPEEQKLNETLPCNKTSFLGVPCRPSSVSSNSFKYLDQDCLAKCSNAPFSGQSAQQLRLLNLALACLCLICNGLVLGVWIVRQEKCDKHPKHSLVRISTCFLFISVLHVVTFFVNNQTCVEGHMASQVVYECKYNWFPLGEIGQESVCKSVAAVHYFLEIAAVMWWMVLILTFFLEAVLKWTDEAIKQKSGLFSLIAWGSAALISVCSILFSRIGPDLLTGFCVFTSECLVYSVLVVLLQVIATFMFLLTLKSFQQINRFFKSQSVQMDKFERLILQVICLFLMFFVPNLFRIFFHLYTFWSQDSWTIFNVDNPTLLLPMTLFVMRIIATFLPGLFLCLHVSVGPMYALCLTSAKRFKPKFYSPAANH